MTEKIIDRLFQYLDNKHIPHTRFEKNLGLSNGYLNTMLKRKADIGESVLQKIIDYSQDINIDWLITGKGDMFLIKELTLRTDRIIERQEIPFYGLVASAGLTKVFQDQENVLDYIRIPNMPRCDGAINITGDSMYPILKSGDIVLFKIHQTKEIILWGQMYILSIDIDGDISTVVKYVRPSNKGKQYIKLVSQNENHEPFDIHLDSVQTLALVKGMIRISQN